MFSPLKLNDVLLTLFPPTPTPLKKVTPTFSRLSRLMINSQIGGTSGAIYSLLFTAAHNFIHNHYFIQSNNDDSKKQQQQPSSGKKIIEKFWLKLIEYCMERLSCYGGARINDRSMIGKYSKNQNFQKKSKFSNQSKIHKFIGLK